MQLMVFRRFVDFAVSLRHRLSQLPSVKALVATTVQVTLVSKLYLVHHHHHQRFILFQAIGREQAVVGFSAAPDGVPAADGVPDTFSEHGVLRSIVEERQPSFVEAAAAGGGQDSRPSFTHQRRLAGEELSAGKVLEELRANVGNPLSSIVDVEGGLADSQHPITRAMDLRDNVAHLPAYFLPGLSSENKVTGT
eukprot:GHVS01000265.1.p1 GENE.GHVS01000265.1~~GHVS01000265.1.p1  ORF type:complete len:194 (+),score=38.72 GHVS01000265.1:345-926(+)